MINAPQGIAVHFLQRLSCSLRLPHLSRSLLRHQSAAIPSLSTFVFHSILFLSCPSLGPRPSITQQAMLRLHVYAIVPSLPVSLITAEAQPHISTNLHSLCKIYWSPLKVLVLAADTFWLLCLWNKASLVSGKMITITIVKTSTSNICNSLCLTESTQLCTPPNVWFTWLHLFICVVDVWLLQAVFNCVVVGVNVCAQSTVELRTKTQLHSGQRGFVCCGTAPN